MAGRIRITSGDAAGRLVEVEDELRLGRKGEGPGKLPGDVEVSRAHARVWLDPATGLTVEDAGSTNGTFVNGARITEPTPLSPGDVLRMGTTTMEVEAEPPWAAAEPAAEAEAPPEPEAPREPFGEPEAAPPEPEPQAAREEEPPQPESAAEPYLAEPPPQPEPPTPTREPEPSPEPAARAAPGAGVPKPLVYVLASVFVMAALGIAAVLYFTREDEDESAPAGPVAGPPALVAAATEAGCSARDFPPARRGVVGSPPYSGDPAAKPASDGIWETAPPPRKIVSSLEKGRIVMWHKPGDEKVYDLLREVGDESPRHMLLVPTAAMPHRVAASAWGHVLGCPRINGSTAAAIKAFRDAYRDKAPTFEP